MVVFRRYKYDQDVEFVFRDQRKKSLVFLKPQKVDTEFKRLIFLMGITYIKQENLQIDGKTPAYFGFGTHEVLW